MKELFYIIFEKSSSKRSFGRNRMNYEILHLSVDSQYLWSVALKAERASHNDRSHSPSLPIPRYQGMWVVQILHP